MLILHPITIAFAIVAAGMILFGPLRRLVPVGRRDRVAGIMIRYVLYGWLVGALFFMPVHIIVAGVRDGEGWREIAGPALASLVMVPTIANILFVAFAAVGIPSAMVAGLLHAGVVAWRGTLFPWIAPFIGLAGSGAGLLVWGGVPLSMGERPDTVAWFASGAIAATLMGWGDEWRARRAHG